MEAGQGSRPPAGGERSTWIAFAGVMMVILGSLDAIWGLAAILNDEVVVVGGHGALIFDITTWGWVRADHRCRRRAHGPRSDRR